nr:DNA helicase [Tanacetum cinerariifolium]
ASGAINSYRDIVVTNRAGTCVPIYTVFGRLRDMLTRNGGSNFAPRTGESHVYRPPPVITRSPHMFDESLGLTGWGVTNSFDDRVVTRADRTNVVDYCPSNTNLPTNGAISLNSSVVVNIEVVRADSSPRVELALAYMDLETSWKFTFHGKYTCLQPDVRHDNASFWRAGCTGLDPKIVEGLIHVLDEYNGLVRMFRTARDRCNAGDIPRFKIRLYNVGGVRGYELPTSDVLGAVVFEDGPRSRIDFDVIIEFRGGPPKRISKLHQSYMLLHFPLLFVFGQPRFYLELILKPRNGRVLYTIEFQKRGLPHCHTLLWVGSKSKITDASQINEYISADLPDPVKDPRDSKQWKRRQIATKKSLGRLTYVHLSSGKIVLAVASSGIASLLLPAGRTAHSRFKLPLELTDESLCHVKKNTQLGKLLVKTNLIIWDEAPMNDRRCFETLDRILRNITSSPDLIFGGKTVVLRGDFHQTLPVKKGAGKQELIIAFVAESYLWWHFKICSLTVNMRLLRSDLNAEQQQWAEVFAKWLLDVGNSETGEPDNEDDQDSCWVSIPPEYCGKTYFSKDEAIPMGKETSETELLYPMEYLNTTSFLSFAPMSFT